MHKHSHLKEKAASVSSGVSGAVSVLGSYQICHSICLGIIALLAFLGITINFMPLLFLTKVAIPFWIAAFILLLITFYFFVTKKCISKNVLLFNSGLIIAGTPFQQVQQLSPYLMIIGSLLVIASIMLYLKRKIKK